MFVIQTKNKIQLTCGSRSLFVWCVLQLLSWLRQGGRSMETNNGGVTAMHLGTASVGIFIILSPCIKLDVLARLIRSKSHSVDCNEFIRLLKSCSVDTLRKEAGRDLVPSASAIKKIPHIGENLCYVMISLTKDWAIHILLLQPGTHQMMSNKSVRVLSLRPLGWGSNWAMLFDFNINLVFAVCWCLSLNIFFNNISFQLNFNYIASV